MKQNLGKDIREKISAARCEVVNYIAIRWVTLIPIRRKNTYKEREDGRGGRRASLLCLFVTVQQNHRWGVSPVESSAERESVRLN